MEIGRNAFHLVRAETNRVLAVIESRHTNTYKPLSLSLSLPVTLSLSLPLTLSTEGNGYISRPTNVRTTGRPW